MQQQLPGHLRQGSKGAPRQPQVISPTAYFLTQTIGQDQVPPPKSRGQQPGAGQRRIVNVNRAQDNQTIGPLSYRDG